MSKQTVWQIDSTHLNHHGDALLERARAAGPEVIRLDCSAVHSLDSQGWSNLVALNNSLAGDLTLVNVDDHLHQLLRLTGMHAFLDVRR